MNLLSVSEVSVADPGEASPWGKEGVSPTPSDLELRAPLPLICDPLSSFTIAKDCRILNSPVTLLITVSVLGL